MMERMGTWVLSVACCAVVVSLLEALLPKGSLKKVGVFAGGALMALVVLEPFGSVELASLGSYAERFFAEQEESETSLTEESQSLLEKLIAEESRTYILEWAEELGLSCRVTVECDSTEEGLPVPVGVTVTSAAGETQLNALAERIESELGIPREHQTYRKEK